MRFAREKRRRKLNYFFSLSFLPLLPRNDVHKDLVTHSSRMEQEQGTHGQGGIRGAGGISLFSTLFPSCDVNKNPKILSFLTQLPPLTPTKQKILFLSPLGGGGGWVTRCLCMKRGRREKEKKPEMGKGLFQGDAATY